jgi:hypothetical protein
MIRMIASAYFNGPHKGKVKLRGWKLWREWIHVSIYSFNKPYYLYCAKHDMGLHILTEKGVNLGQTSPRKRPPKMSRDCRESRGKMDRSAPRRGVYM